jgi:hypothetical protein
MATYLATSIGRGKVIKAPSVDGQLGQIVVCVGVNELGFSDAIDLINAIEWPTTDPEIAGYLWSNKGLLTVSDGVAGIGNWRIGQTFIVS